MTGPTPDITAASVVRHGVLRLTFTDGLSGEVDMLDRMRGPVFEQARTRSGFAAMAVDNETGTITWTGGAISRRTRSTTVSAPGCGLSRAPQPDPSRHEPHP